MQTQIDADVLAAAMNMPIADNAAHLIAALLSEGSGLDIDALSIDAREDFELLRIQLDALGALEPYKGEDSRISL